jgi:hypothetical protein
LQKLFEADFSTTPPPKQQDKLTSVAIPLAFTVASVGLLAKGIDDLRWGKNRKDGF